MFKISSRSNIKLLALAAVCLSATWLQSASAQSAAENVMPLAKVCLSGQSCVGTTVGTASGTMSNAAPASAAAQAVTAVVEEVVEEVAEQATNLVAAVTADSSFDPAAKYQQSCFACHGTGAANAPKLDDKAEWEKRMAPGMDAVMVNVMNGINAMPPKGLCMDCSESDLVALVEYMTSQ